MIHPDDPIHPVAAALIGVMIVLAIAARLAFTHGLSVAFLALIIGTFGVLFVYSTAEMLTWAPDDPRWDAYMEAQEMERQRNRWL